MQRLVETRGRAHSLWLFPTKAPSQDQSKVFITHIEELGEDWHSYIYDGDTPPSVRRTLREPEATIAHGPRLGTTFRKQLDACASSPALKLQARVVQADGLR
jgi:hypothetical protein